MTKEASNKAIIKEAYDKWHATKASDEGIAHWLEIMSDSIKFKSLADGAQGANFTSRIRSQADMKRYFEGLTSTMDMLYYRIDHYVAEGDKVVCVGMTAWKVKETGVEMETPKCDVITMKDDKIIAFYEYYDTAKLLDAAPDG